jgi:radical SAM protein with 4Fe4S-binding SPASM domain
MLAADWGIEQVVISTLDFVPNPHLKRETFWNDSEDQRTELTQRLDRVVAAGADLGVEICYQLPSPLQPRNTCTENTRRALFISADGDVAPCVFAHLPVETADFLQSDETHSYQRWAFGNIRQNSLSQIWSSKSYRNWRGDFAVGRIAGQCVRCPKRFIPEEQ